MRACQDGVGWLWHLAAIARWVWYQGDNVQTQERPPSDNVGSSLHLSLQSTHISGSAVNQNCHRRRAHCKQHPRRASDRQTRARVGAACGLENPPKGWVLWLVKYTKQTLNCISINVVLMGTTISSLLPDRGDDRRTPEANTSTSVSCTFGHEYSYMVFTYWAKAYIWVSHAMNILKHMTMNIITGLIWYRSVYTVKPNPGQPSGHKVPLQ